MSTSTTAEPVTTPPATAPLPARTRRQREGPATRDRTLILPPADTAPRAARAALRDCLAQWNLGHLQDDAELILDELVANSVCASKAAAPQGEEPAAITVKIAVEDDDLLLLQAWDPDPAPPPPDYTPGTWDESGRGLMIVKALAHHWGTTPGPNGGKHVHATLRTANQPPGDGPPAPSSTGRKPGAETKKVPDAS
jgi:anti-sigma regulatory factor (Ser/Thr protein kinase)